MTCFYLLRTVAPSTYLLSTLDGASLGGSLRLVSCVPRTGCHPWLTLGLVLLRPIGSAEVASCRVSAGLSLRVFRLFDCQVDFASVCWVGSLASAGHLGGDRLPHGRCLRPRFNYALPLQALQVLQAGQPRPADPRCLGVGVRIIRLEGRRIIWTPKTSAKKAATRCYH